MRTIFLLTSLIIFFLDRVTKFLALKELNHPVEVIPGFFSLRLAENRGAAFSIFSTGSEPVRKFFLIVVPLLICIYILYYVLKNRLSPRISISLGLIFGGALGNLYDRVFSGKVLDFLDFYIGNYHYPTFNVADVAVFLGTVALILSWRKS
ncbi:signal peptidase II [Balnearium lithotrophicum]|uniref:Lipoprotein signal peptidase n=1 Tax=Balnearium lithotrophicum TaxID=223788 RepID=A0A521AFP2_9BACT|nr:signal peptidase II [Balnearium lithotrophicum]SMO33643.1 signal peptidase II [Balnearium lithotrophicum]